MNATLQLIKSGFNEAVRAVGPVGPLRSPQRAMAGAESPRLGLSNRLPEPSGLCFRAGSWTTADAVRYAASRQSPRTDQRTPRDERGTSLTQPGEPANR